MNKALTLTIEPLNVYITENIFAKVILSSPVFTEFEAALATQFNGLKVVQLFLYTPTLDEVNYVAEDLIELLMFCAKRLRENPDSEYEKGQYIRIASILYHRYLQEGAQYPLGQFVDTIFQPLAQVMEDELHKLSTDLVIRFKEEGKVSRVEISRYLALRDLLNHIIKKGLRDDIDDLFLRYVSVKSDPDEQIFVGEREFLISIFEGNLRPENLDETRGELWDLTMEAYKYIVNRQFIPDEILVKITMLSSRFDSDEIMQQALDNLFLDFQEELLEVFEWMSNYILQEHFQARKVPIEDIMFYKSCRKIIKARSTSLLTQLRDPLADYQKNLPTSLLDFNEEVAYFEGIFSGQNI